MSIETIASALALAACAALWAKQRKAAKRLGGLEEKAAKAESELGRHGRQLLQYDAYARDRFGHFDRAVLGITKRITSLQEKAGLAPTLPRNKRKGVSE